MLAGGAFLGTWQTESKKTLQLPLEARACQIRFEIKHISCTIDSCTVCDDHTCASFVPSNCPVASD